MQKRKTSPSPVKVSRPVKVSPLALRLDSESKSAWAAAAGLRRISVSASVRTMAVPQALREVAAARDQTIVLSPDEQLAFWRALNAAAQLTPVPKTPGGDPAGSEVSDVVFLGGPQGPCWILLRDRCTR